MKKYFAIILLFLSFCAFSQNKAKGNSKYDKLAYIDAIEVYENVAKKGLKSKELFEKLGNAYYFNGMLDKSKIWYDKLFEFTSDIDAEYYFRYAQSLKAVRDYDKADIMMEQFFQLTNDYRGELYIKNKLYLKEIKGNQERYKIENAGINSSESDYGSYFLGNKMYFVSSRKFVKNTNKLDSWTNQNFTNLMSAEFDSIANVVHIDELTDEINTKYHESSLIFTKDGKTMYFTRNNYYKKKIEKKKKKIVLLKLYKASLINNKWDKIIELPFNSDEYNIAHPALSNDEKTMYFASDMPGGYGESDLYKISINDDGTFGKPINLGPKINTKSRETFPYINKSDELYFASDGHVGLGGLDLFKSIPDKNGEFTLFENLGEPVNSEKDDFGFSESPFEKIFFISSNRNGGKGYDDIYKLIEQDKPEEIVLEQIVVDANTRKPLENVKISIYDSNYNLINETVTDNLGGFKTSKIRKDREYIIKIEYPDYFTSEKRYKGNDYVVKGVLPINPKLIAVDYGDDLIKLLNLSIYFDLDKYFIRPDAEVELAMLIKVMLKYPQLKVHIKSHTDSRQSDSYNLKLSDLRAKATRNYMIKKGVPKDRISAKGYGETELLNKCSNGVPCSKEEHQLNRRSEFIIIK